LEGYQKDPVQETKISKTEKKLQNKHKKQIQKEKQKRTIKKGHGRTSRDSLRKKSGRAG
jgi:hypothetical protein